MWRSPVPRPAQPAVRDALNIHMLTGRDCLGLVAWPVAVGAMLLILGVLLP
jgi:hypothetical protein